MTTETKDIQKVTPPPSVAMTRNGFEPKDMDQAWRFANALARSAMVPARYQGKPDDCIIALDLSMRLGVSYLAVMQHVYNVQGRPAMEAVLSTGLTNASGVFCDPLEYEVEGDDPKKDGYRVRAYAKRKSTGTVLYGPWIDWPLVRGEGWDKKNGSKWLTMPEQMFHYRAASWFSRRHCPEVTMGMLTPEEAEEIPPKHVDSVTFDEAKEITEQEINDKSGTEPVDTQIEPNGKEAEGDMPAPTFLEEEDPDTKAEAERQKAALAAAEAPTAPGKYTCKAAKCSNKGVVFENPKMIRKKNTDVPQCPACFGTNLEQVEAA